MVTVRRDTVRLRYVSTEHSTVESRARSGPLLDTDYSTVTKTLFVQKVSSIWQKLQIDSSIFDLTKRTKEYLLEHLSTNVSANIK